jgi:hypothetical protein
MKRHMMVLGAAITVSLGLAQACLAETCSDHALGVGHHDPTLSSPQIHKHREGVIVPLGPTGPTMPLSSINVTAETTFQSCSVRNFTVNVRAEFVVGPPHNDSNAAFAVAFPLTTHALYGAHNEFKGIAVTINNTEVPYRVAMDHRLWHIVQGEVWYKGRRINRAVHPLLANAKDLNIVAPHLVARGYDLIIYWHYPAASVTAANTSRMAVSYTSNTDDFSGCCDEVHDPTKSSDPHHFYFDLSNARYWRGPRACTVTLKDSSSALWSSVPTTDMQTTFTHNSIILTSDPASTNAELEDLAVPTQPAVFGVDPRRWPIPSPAIQTFTLSWKGGTASNLIDHAVVDRIEPVGGIDVHASLPITLSPHNPTDTFTAAVMPPLASLAYIGCASPCGAIASPDTIWRSGICGRCRPPAHRRVGRLQ